MRCWVGGSAGDSPARAETPKTKRPIWKRRHEGLRGAIAPVQSPRDPPPYPRSVRMEATCHDPCTDADERAAIVRTPASCTGAISARPRPRTRRQARMSRSDSSRRVRALEPRKASAHRGRASRAARNLRPRAVRMGRGASRRNRATQGDGEDRLGLFASAAPSRPPSGQVGASSDVENRVFLPGQR